MKVTSGFSRDSSGILSPVDLGLEKDLRYPCESTKKLLIVHPSSSNVVSVAKSAEYDTARRIYVFKEGRPILWDLDSCFWPVVVVVWASIRGPNSNLAPVTLIRPI